MFLRVLAIAAAFFAADARNSFFTESTASSNCISFQVSAGTGCQWMCNYCANTLGTTDYYFTNGVCTYETGGCIGSPQVGILYTCCSN